ncbi:MAG: ATP synthase F1 subunit delta [Clostridia bacterium]|nr:ATP synthase F1 subunit delta [Clostridia bacterium]
MTEIIKEYSTALFMLASEKGYQKEYAGILNEIKKIFLDNPSYLSLLSSPSVPIVERLSAIDDAFREKTPEYILSYLKLLCEKGRIGEFIESVDEYNALLNASERVFTAKVTSAQALTNEEKGKLIQKLEQSQDGKVQAEYYVDATLLGGMIVEIDGKVMDGSLRRRLQEVKEVINQ